jgi:hypothetical protein
MRRIATFMVGFALLAAPASALASSSSTCQAYNSETCGPTQITTTVPTPNQQLPFTGLDVVLLVVGGGTLLGAGFVVRRVSRRLS